MHAESRAVRLDVYVKDEKHTIYNVEMQCESNANLPRRSRYYQSMIDMDLIDKNDNYNKLNQSFIIFICTFDPFKKGRHQYTFENRCLEDTALGLDDKTTKIFLNTKGTTDDVSNELLEFFTYLENSSKEQADHTDCGLVKLLHERVDKVRASKEMEVEFMKLWMIEKEKFEEGLEKGTQRMNALIEKLTEADRIDDLIRSTKDKKFQEQLFDEFNL